MGPGFLVARYATRSSLSFYGGYQLGRAFAVVGMVQNPRTGYREAILGGGWHSLSGGLTLALAAANTSDGWFAQVYLMPSFRAGRVSVEGTVEAYQPMERRGVRELDVSPIVGLLSVSRAASVGVAYHLSAPENGPSGHAAGPALRIGIPRGSATLELLRGLARASSELRLTVRTSR